MCWLLQKALQPLGCRLKIASSSKELEDSETRQSGLLILDMPTFEFSERKIAELLKGFEHRPPVIIIGATRVRGDQKLAGLGCDFIDQPFGIEQLVSKIKATLGP